MNESKDWSFSVEEVSVGAYRARGVDEAGRSVEVVRTDPDEALAECRQAAAEMDNQNLSS
jgi:hypothetical protein